MRPLRLLSTVALATLGLAGVPLEGQEFSVRASDGLVIPLGDGRLAVLQARDNQVVVGSLVDGPEAGGSPADIRADDRVTSFQGVRLPSIERLRLLYDSAPVGAELALGLTRGTAAEHLIRFKRSAAPAGRHMAVSAGGASAGAWSTAGGAGEGGDVVIAGVHFRENDQGMPEVSHRTSDPAAATVALRTGDVVTLVNGRSVSALAGLRLWYDRIAPGAEIVLTVLRDGRQLELRFPKPLR